VLLHAGTIGKVALIDLGHGDLLGCSATAHSRALRRGQAAELSGEEFAGLRLRGFFLHRPSWRKP
jgi:hypothetical protein